MSTTVLPNDATGIIGNGRFFGTGSNMRYAINFNAGTSYACMIAGFGVITGFDSTDVTIDAGGFTSSLLSGSIGISPGRRGCGSG